MAKSNASEESDPIPTIVRLTPELRERLREVWEASNANALLRPNPQDIAKRALGIGLESRKLAG